MKERPVIFNGEMVRAILEGRKAQTRRAISDRHLHLIDVASQVGECYPLESGIDHVNSQSYYREHCPFDQVGDQLWVRETWGVVSHDFDENERIIDWVPDRPATAIHEMPFGNGYYSGHAIYAADGEFTWGDDDGHSNKSCWKPSIHMPRSACRILLEITAVRVERLNDISESDAKAEGVRAIENNFGNGPAYCDYLLPNLDDAAEWYNRASDSFKSLWKSIYGAENWSANPWVWVIEFKHVEVRDASK
ncbi:hypothetical protein C3463_07475 [Serratia marcescens]|uniref:hypothetical protein n=1 Tax=Serratia marcescens TaxID=615 RepID=UPI000CDDDFF1|nr:hypothetical protein [Serratia marcescens]POX30818.1 hypothetical protein C3463_07475 [Serratia marcescens]